MDKIFKKINANDSKSYQSYLNKLVDQCNVFYRHSVNKKKLLMLIVLF